MRIGFLVDADLRSGIGNLLRSLSLARLLLKRKTEPVFIVPNDYCLEKVKDADLKAVMCNALEPHWTPIRELELDVLVLDLPRPHEPYQQFLKEFHSRGVRIVGLDYFDYTHDNIDVIVNLFNHLGDARPSAQVDYYEGLDYAIIKDSLLSHRRTKYELMIDNILVTFGGADPRKRTLDAMNILEESISENAEVNITVGTMFPHDQEIRRKANDLGWTVHEHLQDIGYDMSMAGMGFCGSGTTLMEFLFIGTPVFVWPQSPEELGFSSYLESQGLVRVLPDSLKQAGQIFREIISNPQVLQAMSTRGRASVDGLGSERIIDIITGGKLIG